MHLKKQVLNFEETEGIKDRNELKTGRNTIYINTKMMDFKTPQKPDACREMQREPKHKNQAKNPEMKIAQDLPEHSQMLPERSQTLPERSQALPEHSQSLSEHSQMLPEHSQALPEHSQTLPKHSQSLPKHSQTLPKRSQSLPERSQALPEHSQSLPKRSQALPKHSQAKSENVNFCKTAHYSFLQALQLIIANHSNQVLNLKN